MRLMFVLFDCYFEEHETCKGETSGKKRKHGESELSIEQGHDWYIDPKNSIMVGIGHMYCMYCMMYWTKFGSFSNQVYELSRFTDDLTVPILMQIHQRLVGGLAGSTSAAVNSFCAIPKNDTCLLAWQFISFIAVSFFRWLSSKRTCLWS